MAKLRVLIFSASFGAGHIRAAEALIEALRAREAEVEVNHLDFGAFVGKTFNTFVKGVYIQMIKRAPKIWGKFYYSTARVSPDSLFQRFLNRLGQSGFENYVNSFQPDVIICTYPTVAGILSELKQKGALHVPLVTVITDFTVHSQWIHADVDLYIVGSEEVRDGLVSKGISAQRIQVTGIPVSLKFEQEINRDTIIGDLGLSPDRQTVLVMGGAYGVLHQAKRICSIVANTTLNIQSVVVCGTDKRLYQSLEDTLEGAQNPIVRIGFAHNVEELMAASDIIITKAGGLTVSEALTRGLPLLIFKPIPGQEEENTRFLRQKGACCVAETYEEIETNLRAMLQKPETLKEMSAAAHGAIPGRAAERAAEHVMQLIGAEIPFEELSINWKVNEFDTATQRRKSVWDGGSF